MHLDTPFTQRQEMQAQLRNWLHDYGEGNGVEWTHLITLTPNDPSFSENRLRAKLREWSKRMNRGVVGTRWNRKPHQVNEWIAFPERLNSNPHLHLLFAVSKNLPEGRRRLLTNDPSALDGISVPRLADRQWLRLVRSGETDVQLVHSLSGAVNYITKEVKNPKSWDAFITSREFDAQ